MRARGDLEALRLLIIDRDHAVQAALVARTALADLLVTPSVPLRAAPPLARQASPGRLRRPRMAAWGEPAHPCHPPGPARLGQRLTALAAQAIGREAQIAEIVENMAPGLGADALTSRRPCSPGSAPARSAAKPPSPCCRARHRSRSPPTPPAVAGSATASSTAPCTPSRLPECAAARPPSATPLVAVPKATDREISHC